jgi:hypothetical protein
VKASKQITWLLDSGFDDVAVWRTIWEQQEHVVCRVSHRDRIVQWQTEQGEWTSGPLEKAAARGKLLAEVHTKMEVKRGKQAHSKKQDVDVEISACLFQITYHSEMRRAKDGASKTASSLPRRAWAGIRSKSLIGRPSRPWSRSPGSLLVFCTRWA